MPLPIRGTPFVPGQARGLLHSGPAPAADAVRLLDQRELGAFTGEAAALLVVDGAPLSHPMIRLLGRGIPTLMISRAQAAALSTGTEVVVDGQSGWVDTPAAAASWPLWQAPESPRAGKPVQTADGQAVALRASVGDVAAAAAARGAGATAIGLVRSEYLAGGESPPDAARFEGALGELCRAAGSLSVTVRLLDVAADKRPAWLAPQPGMTGALGLQGPRLYDLAPVWKVVQAQLRALARLAVRHELAVLVPFLARPEEFRRWRKEIERLLPVPLPLGAMLETPAAVLALRDFANLADFVAIGCNDLMQCLFAADRDVPEVSHLLDPYAPVLFRLLRQAAEAAGEDRARVQICGLLPQVPGVLPVLLGLGYRAFSLEPRLIPHLAAVVLRTDMASAERLAAAVCAAVDADGVRELLGAGAGSAWALGSAHGLA